jgi:hypothetical protein
MTASAQTLPPGVALYRLAIGHYVSRALALAATLGIADHVKSGPTEVAALARATGTNASALRRVLRLLASVEILEEGLDGRFSLTPLGELLREDAPGSMKASVTLFAGAGIQDSWKELEFCVRTGLPALKKNDPSADAFAMFEKDPAAAANFDRAMATFAPQTAAAVAAAYDFSAFGTVADLGGGNGALLIGILKANPGLSGIVFDLPRVAERAKANVDAAGLANRCKVIGGSFFERVPRGADAYLLKHVIHDWNDEQAAAILATVRAAMAPGAKLLIVEGLYPERIDSSFAARGAAANDVNMLVCTGGRQRSETEFRELYASAGFALTKTIPTAAGFAVIEGEPRA